MKIKRTVVTEYEMDDGKRFMRRAKRHYCRSRVGVNTGIRKKQTRDSPSAQAEQDDERLSR